MREVTKGKEGESERRKRVTGLRIGEGDRVMVRGLKERMIVRGLKKGGGMMGNERWRGERGVIEDV